MKRVQALLEERQYIPSMAGILLAQNSSKIIGIFINDHEKYEGHTLEDSFIASSLNHLSREIEGNGQFMMVKKAKRPEEILQFASMWNMDGLVIIGFCDQDYQYLRSHMRIPFVVYDGFCERTERICNITIDNFDGGFQMGRCFREQGHKTAICISDNGICVDKVRQEGFRAGFQGSVEALLIPMHREERWNFYRRNLDKFRTVTAVFAASDYYAMDLILFLSGHGLRVPEDLSVGGFDDIPLCTLISPALTTIRQDNALRAKIAIEKLKALREGRETETEVLLPVTLIQRDSVGRLPFLQP